MKLILACMISGTVRLESDNLMPGMLRQHFINGLLPSYLSKIHPKYATPHWSITTLSLMSLLLACSGGYRQLIIVATISMMLLFVGAFSTLIS